MKKKDYSLVPGYYEWHFIQNSRPEQVLLNICDPAEDCFHKTMRQIRDWVESLIFGEREQAADEENFSRVTELDNLPPFASTVIARTLYRYYAA